MLTIPQRQALLADIKDDAHRDVLQSHLLYDAREILRAPEALLTEFPRLPGTDGRKMSKSYENTITLFEKPKTVANKLARMKTDSARIRRDDKGNPTTARCGNCTRFFQPMKPKLGRTTAVARPASVVWIVKNIWHNISMKP